MGRGTAALQRNVTDVMLNEGDGVSPRRTLLFCAHPGHELRVFGWLKMSRPTVCFLTDGSGSVGPSRLAHSSNILASAGAEKGPLYGIAPDRSIYAALLDGNVAAFVDMARDLSEVLLAGQYSDVVGDATEWYNPSHDVARMLVDAAVRIASGRGARINNYAFPLVGDPRRCPPGSSSTSIAVKLDTATLHEKIETARAYARDSKDALIDEVEEAIERFGVDAFGEESLFLASGSADLEEPRGGGKPFYETYGEAQVAGGRYSSVIRWKEHVRPVGAALRQLAGLPVSKAVTAN
jgi:hypothetical protein